jgi:hypothetical protein
MVRLGLVAELLCRSLLLCQVSISRTADGRFVFKTVLDITAPMCMAVHGVLGVCRRSVVQEPSVMSGGHISTLVYYYVAAINFPCALSAVNLCGACHLRWRMAYV